MTDLTSCPVLTCLRADTTRNTVTEVRVRCQDHDVVTSLLDRAIYSYSDVDRLVGLRPGTARRWLEGYERSDRYYDPVPPA
jgi:hypothetical protein